MDPDQALQDLRSAIKRLDKSVDTDEFINATALTRDAAQALDEWLSKGGFLPKAWER
jgi:ribosomal protein S20